MCDVLTVVTEVIQEEHDAEIVVKTLIRASSILIRIHMSRIIVYFDRDLNISSPPPATSLTGYCVSVL